MIGEARFLIVDDIEDNVDDDDDDLLPVDWRGVAEHRWPDERLPPL